MKFSLSREALLKPLQLVIGVVERRQTLPILSNVLFSLSDKNLSIKKLKSGLLHPSFTGIHTVSYTHLTLPTKRIV